MDAVALICARAEDCKQIKTEQPHGDESRAPLGDHCAVRHAKDLTLPPRTRVALPRVLGLVDALPRAQGDREMPLGTPLVRRAEARHNRQSMRNSAWSSLSAVSSCCLKRRPVRLRWRWRSELVGTPGTSMDHTMVETGQWPSAAAGLHAGSRCGFVTLWTQVSSRGRACEGDHACSVDVSREPVI